MSQSAPEPLGGPAAPGTRASTPPTPTGDSPLIAEVWCRQVDSEAESPGYTSRPEDFPGRRETLDIIRIVGNLAINVSDTTDYWDPDPSTKLAYYNNLFLYPAYGGRYLCLGRMFLSTEDRPRLGMKTHVLDAPKVFAEASPGAALRRWHLMMQPLPKTAAEATPDPSMVQVLADAFTFWRGDPAFPVVGMVSDNWNSALASLFSLIDAMPASLIAESGILVFPYYLPAPQVNLPEFTETFPLSLALMRIPRAEAAGDRHRRRVASWATSGVRLIDLTHGVAPETLPRGAVPLPLQWWQGGPADQEKASVLRKRIDRVEMPRYFQEAVDPANVGGLARRRALARIAKATESVSLISSLPGGTNLGEQARAVGVSDDYVQEPDVSAPPAPASVAEARPVSTPPWASAKGPPRVERVGVVTRPPVPLGGGVASEGTGAAVPAGLVAGPGATMADLQAYIDRKLASLAAPSSGLTPDVQDRLGQEIERRVAQRTETLLSPAALDARVLELLARRPPPDANALLNADVRAKLAELVNAAVDKRTAEIVASGSRGQKELQRVLQADLEARVNGLIGGQGGDNRLGKAIDAAVTARIPILLKEDRGQIDGQLQAVLEEVRAQRKAAEGLQSAIRAEVSEFDDKLKLLTERLIPILKKTWLKIDEIQSRPAGGGADQKMVKLREELWKEMRRMEIDLSARTKAILDRVEINVQNQGRIWLTLVTQLSTLAEQRRELQQTLTEERKAWAEEADETSPAPSETEGASSPSSDPPTAEAAAPEEPPPEPAKSRGARRGSF